MNKEEYGKIWRILDKCCADNILQCYDEMISIVSNKNEKNKQLIKDFQNYIHGYRAEIDADKFNSVRDRFFCKGVYEGMLTGLEVCKRIANQEE